MNPPRSMKVFPTLLVALLALRALSLPAAEPALPNFLIIFTDDQGYGDLGCQGSTTLRTPRLDRLATEGTRFTSFYAQIVCGPSRSALLTGRQPVRSGGWSMPASEVTLAELLKTRGYATACIGKWDVSNRAPIRERMPNAKGFDSFYGTLGGNDSGRIRMYENNEPAGETADMGGLTRTYTDKALAFLRANRDRPFLLYVAHTMVHSIVGASPEFRGKSRGGLYGDAVEEIDFHSGRLLDALDELGLRDNTLVIFTCDNGPWSNAADRLGPLHQGEVAWGSSGPLREAKGSSYEGGSRVPCLVRWPGRVPAGRVSDAIFSTLDFLPTFGRLAGFAPPADRVIDGVDQTDLLLGRSRTGARDHFHYFSQNELHAVRVGPWKLFLPDRKVFYGYVKDRGTSGLELYNLDEDIGEKRDVAAAHPEVVARLLAFARAYDMPAELPFAGIALPAPGAKGKKKG
ncbi:MAG: Arylsulfatase [Verrucomicrobiota bacterium]